VNVRVHLRWWSVMRNRRERRNIINVRKLVKRNYLVVSMFVVNFVVFWESLTIFV
jgi:hypothetical protein